MTNTEAKRDPPIRERCATCAFRAGTIPNQCEATLLNAIKCVAEGESFYCHEAPEVDGVPIVRCAGWAILRKAQLRAEKEAADEDD